MPLSTPDPTLLDRVALLLQSLFNTPQLRRFCRRHRDGSLAGELPEEVAHLELCYLAAEEFFRRGWIDAILFQALVVERPQRSEDICHVAGVCGVA